METTELCIVGSGPAGISAAIYAARASVRCLLLGGTPKFAADYEIDNYFGFPETISGRELRDRGLAQAARFGVRHVEELAVGLHVLENGHFEVVTPARRITACSLILATGVARSKPNVPGLSDFEGKGVSWCVTCDGFFVRQKPVAVLGEGDYAASQALELLTYTPHVTLLLGGKAPAMGEAYRTRLAEAGIPVLPGPVERLEGGAGLERAVLKDGQVLDIHGLFVAVGEASSGDFAQALGLTRSGNYIQVDREQQTNVPGVFAAGDCTGGFLQISVAVGEGAIAARSAIAYVRKHCRPQAARKDAKES